jgi:hypothetical protein
MIFQFASIGVRECKLFESTRAHQKCSAYESTLGFLFYKKLKFHFLGWIRTAAALSPKTAQKQPARLFLAARLA